MTFSRLVKHVLTSQRQVKKHFSTHCRDNITSAIRDAEATHMGEIRFAIEAGLEPGQILRGMTPRERAIEVFSELRVWDTQHNSGVLIYVLIADRAIEIVADRGINEITYGDPWRHIADIMQVAFANGQFEAGAVNGIAAVTEELIQHFPFQGNKLNELSNDVAFM